MEAKSQSSVAAVVTCVAAAGKVFGCWMSLETAATADAVK